MDSFRDYIERKEDPLQMWRLDEVLGKIPIDREIAELSGQRLRDSGPHGWVLDRMNLSEVPAGYLAYSWIVEVEKTRGYQFEQTSDVMVLANDVIKRAAVAGNVEWLGRAIGVYVYGFVCLGKDEGKDVWDAGVNLVDHVFGEEDPRAAERCFYWLVRLGMELKKVRVNGGKITLEEAVENLKRE